MQLESLIFSKFCLPLRRCSIRFPLQVRRCNDPIYLVSTRTHLPTTAQRYRFAPFAQFDPPNPGPLVPFQSYRYPSRIWGRKQREMSIAQTKTRQTNHDSSSLRWKNSRIALLDLWSLNALTFLGTENVSLDNIVASCGNYNPRSRFLMFLGSSPTASHFLTSFQEYWLSGLFPNRLVWPKLKS